MAKRERLPHGNSFFKLVLVCLTVLYTVVININFNNTDIILILEHSFHLAQQNNLQPISIAVQKYDALNISARVKTALKDVIKQYSKASQRDKVDMIFNIIVQNCIGELNVSLVLYLLTTQFRYSSSWNNNNSLRSGHGFNGRSQCGMEKELKKDNLGETPFLELFWNIWWNFYS